MQEKEIFRFEKSGMKSKGAWTFVGFGTIALFGGGIYSFIGILMLAYGIYLLTKKSKVIVYTTGFVISEGKDLKNISFDRVLGIKGELGQKVKILYLKKPFSAYNENELNNISNNLNTLSESIIFDDELLEKDFINVFNIIKEQFKNYVFEHYNNDLEKIITSPYLFEQISNDKLNFTRTKFWGGLADEIIQLQYGDAINVTTRKKAYVTNGRGDIRQAGQSFEPQWQFASTSTKCDTINLINATIIQEILSKKYNIKFI
ncbi:hypothetical protein [Leptotrichia sp. oral taxon 223]|uniref:hypothetical protein n=1 Tax=Leptotrichia sp. oral taxon 223 TaxID=712363 RepID=UPI0015BB7B9A|nr:hypothetical protein [Leptotrichia sp. oral taxon 223]NWO20127.1 hypothetical protein [Leptotrichia sp. oral taxon 223]